MSEKSPNYEVHKESIKQNCGNSLVYGVVNSDGYFEFKPTLHINTAKSWIKQGHEVTTFKPIGCTTNIDEIY